MLSCGKSATDRFPPVSPPGPEHASPCDPVNHALSSNGDSASGSTVAAVGRGGETHTRVPALVKLIPFGPAESKVFPSPHRNRGKKVLLADG